MKPLFPSGRAAAQTEECLDGLPAERPPLGAFPGSEHDDSSASLAACEEPGSSASPRPLTENQLREQQRRLELCTAADALIARKISLNSAAVLLDVPAATLSRWRTARAAGGDEALIPGASTGRKSKFELTATEAKALRGWVLKKGSFLVGMEWFAQDATCRPETRALIVAEFDRAARQRKQPHWPDSIRRAGRPTLDEELAFRGRKASMAVEFTERRGLEWIDEEGTRRPLEPNTIWESDDMSSNEPFTWTEGSALRIGRQTLATLDVFSGSWLGVTPIGRERDAYRAEDIADHLLDCVRAHGLPTLWRLERGPWENTMIDGVLVGRDAEGREIRWGGLDPLVKIVRAWKSKQKGTVESSFNLLQDLLAHESTSIGRYRGEFEQQTKLYLRAVRGEADAWARFWSMGEFAAAIALAMQRFNHRPKQRRAHGKDLVVPADLYRSGIGGAEPARGRCLPEDQAWRFCPEKREATVRGGHIECTSKHYPLPFRFRVNGAQDGLYLEHGYAVLIAFHPGQPEAGCHVFNAERGPRNREGFQFGQKLLLAPMAEDAPQVNLSPEERAFHARRQANATMRADFRAIGAVGAPAIRRAVVRDGFGNSAEVHTGRPPESTAPPAPERRATKPAIDADEEIARLEQLEADAQARGDLICL